MHLHFIAIGGAAMHSLALELKKKGYHITGSDDIIFDPSKSRLAAHHLLPETLGWFPEKITKKIDSIILGMHAKPDNPELVKAQQLGLTIYSYPEFLYEHAKNKTRVVIGGSHGKTTITAMILHVLHYHDIKTDYMIGATLEGLDTMIHLTEDNDFILMEGDEYLASPIDRRPKFHIYQPNIALLSGISWDHINVFPTYTTYLESFKGFVENVVKGGSITYNEEDKAVKTIVEASQNTIRKIGYHTPEYNIENSQTLLQTPEGPMPVAIFGEHNLSNLAGAKWICQHMGIDEADFYQAIASFKGASGRMEKIAENSVSIAFKDFAHAPSKVAATTKAVKTQYPDKTLVACLELHTYSSLNINFLQEYKNTLNAADIAVVYYTPETVKIKKLQEITSQEIMDAFLRNDLIVYTQAEDFRMFLSNHDFSHTALLLMSSGNYGGLAMENVKRLIQDTV